MRLSVLAVSQCERDLASDALQQSDILSVGLTHEIFPLDAAGFLQRSFSFNIPEQTRCDTCNPTSSVKGFDIV
jgi:hypothetical protein